MPTDPAVINVLAFSGSLRRGSFNTAALVAARELQPPGMAIEIADLAAVPLFNEDVEAAGWPEAVAELRRRVAAADALLIATPEYNSSIPGVLKNALDWLSRVDRTRPGTKSPADAKPVGILGVSPGRLGTARAQLHLRQVCVAMNMLPANRPDVLVSVAHEKFDTTGRLTDEATRKFIADLLAGLHQWTGRLTPSRFPG